MKGQQGMESFFPFPGTSGGIYGLLKIGTILLIGFSGRPVLMGQVPFRVVLSNFVDPFCLEYVFSGQRPT